MQVHGPPAHGPRLLRPHAYVGIRHQDTGHSPVGSLSMGLGHGFLGHGALSLIGDLMGFEVLNLIAYDNYWAMGPCNWGIVVPLAYRSVD